MKSFFAGILAEILSLCLPQVDRGRGLKIAGPVEQTYDILLILGIFFSWVSGFSKGGQR